jgi:hypothetical protein
MNSISVYFTITFVWFAAVTPSSGQTAKPKTRVYNAIVSTVHEGTAYRGVTLEVGDSYITILSKGEEIRLQSASIKTIRFKRKASVGRGAVIGGVTGLVLGAIIGFADGDDQCPPGSWCIYSATAEEKALAGGLVLCAAGTMVGVIAGAAASGQKIRINGDQTTFQSKQEEMKKYMVTTIPRS